MSLKRAFAGAAAAVVKGFGDVAIPTVYRVYGGTTYDEDEGEVVIAFTDQPAVPMIWLEYELEQIDNEAAMRGDMAVMLAQKHLPDVRPKDDDRLVRKDTGTEWRVVLARTDPAEATWMLQARRATK